MCRAVWYWLESKDNPADLGTRGNVSPKDLDIGSIWQVGPKWLGKPKEEWPVREDFRKQEIPGIKKEFQVLNHFTTLTSLVNFSEHIKKNPNFSLNDSHVVISDSSVSVKSKFNLFERFNIQNMGWLRFVKICAQLLAWKRMEPLTALYLRSRPY